MCLGGRDWVDSRSTPSVLLLFFLKMLDRQLKFTVAITYMLVIVTEICWRLMGFTDFKVEATYGPAFILLLNS